MCCDIKWMGCGSAELYRGETCDYSRCCSKSGILPIRASVPSDQVLISSLFKEAPELPCLLLPLFLKMIRHFIPMNRYTESAGTRLETVKR